MRSCSNPHCLGSVDSERAYCKPCQYMYDKGYRAVRKKRASKRAVARLDKGIAR